jgi:hypothetical protein
MEIQCVRRFHLQMKSLCKCTRDVSSSSECTFSNKPKPPLQNSLQFCCYSYGLAGKAGIHVYCSVEQDGCKGRGLAINASEVLGSNPRVS